MANSGYLRIGDAERDQAIELLGRHFADGRLTQEEYEERLSAALRARTRADLTALFSDLPQLPPAVPAVRPRRIMPWLIPVACCLLLALALLVAVDHGIAPFLVVLGAFVVVGGGAAHPEPEMAAGDDAGGDGRAHRMHRGSPYGRAVLPAAASTEQ